jgi:hypothetical protein
MNIALAAHSTAVKKFEKKKKKKKKKKKTIKTHEQKHVEQLHFFLFFVGVMLG